MKAMLIGLEPEYNYPGDFKIWKSNNTKFASNHGASLISRAIAREFNADFVNDFDDFDKLNREYDLCIIAFATHITTKRDVSFFTDVVQKLNMKIVAFSMGVQDYTKTLSNDFDIHDSMMRLLKVVTNKSKWIGVRGPYSASILQCNGFGNVLPVGCPTFYYRLKNDLAITKPKAFNKPLLVYHRTVSEHCWHLVESATILGQDFLDEAIFTDRLKNDPVYIQEEKEYLKYSEGQKKLEYIRNHGVFFRTFDEWFSFIGDHDFVFGPRLHGCIAALIQGIPAVMLYRDLRVKEMADFYGVPSLNYEQAVKMSVDEIFEYADFSTFNRVHPLRYRNFLSFLNLIGVSSRLENNPEVDDFIFRAQDVNAYLSFLHNRLNVFNSFNKELAFLKKVHQTYTSKGILASVSRRILKRLFKT